MSQVQRKPSSPQCGKCKKVRNLCGCGLSARFGTMATILSRCRNLMNNDEHSHTWLFVYHEYQRWFSNSNTSPNPGSFPQIEGWYMAWIMPSGPPKNMPGIDGKVLPVVMHYRDGTSQRAYITTNGSLIAVFSLSSPRYGVYLTGTNTLPREMRVLPTSRTLSLRDISTGRRGDVLTEHGLKKNGGRAISHIVRDDGQFHFICRTFPREFKEEYEEAEVLKNDVRQITPSLLEEFTKRFTPQFTNKEVIASIPYIDILFKEASRNDHADNEVISMVADSSSEISMEVMNKSIRKLKKTVGR